MSILPTGLCVFTQIIDRCICPVPETAQSRSSLSGITARVLILYPGNLTGSAKAEWVHDYSSTFLACRPNRASSLITSPAYTLPSVAGPLRYLTQPCQSASTPIVAYQMSMPVGNFVLVEQAKTAQPMSSLDIHTCNGGIGDASCRYRGSLVQGGPVPRLLYAQNL